MEINYSNAYVDQLVHFFKKVGPESTVYNFDKDSAVQFSGSTIKYVMSKSLTHCWNLLPFALADCVFIINHIH